MKSRKLIMTLIFLVAASFTLIKDLHAKTTEGMAYVIDGDTIVINKQKFRLFGVDAFESNQQCHDEEGKVYLCGNKAANYLDSLIDNKTVACSHKGKSWDRIVAVCHVGEMDLASMMVRKGHALAWKKYSHLYLDDMAYAKQNQKGAWKGSFVEPWVYRKK